MNALAAALAAAGLLAACGGGGSGDAAPTTPTTSNAATVAVSGIAAKGAMINATVEAVAVKDDGSLGDVLQSTTTGNDGSYSLTFNGTQGKPYVIRVRAGANTRHIDEINGEQALPAGFTMRALVVPASTGSVTTSASITPFSELAVSAAAKATGGITPANAAQASATVEQLLGFDPTKVVPTTTSNANASLEQQKLAVMLTAVAKMADDGALGCSGTSSGEKTKCVVEKLAAGASATSKKLEDGGSDISAALGTAVQAVVSTPELAGNVNAAFLEDVKQNLACTTNCAAATVTVPADATVANAIAAAKALLTQLRSDWATMFVRGGVLETGTSTANNEAFKFRAAMTSIQVPANVVVQDLGALLTGIDLWNDVKSGRSTLLSRNRAQGLASGDFTGNFATVSCALYTDGTTSVLATSAETAGAIGCSSVYYVQPGATTTRWRHGFSIVPNADGSFAYSTRARRSTNNNAVNEALSESFSGTVAPTLATSPFGRMIAFSVTGDLAPAFDNGGTALANHHHTWAMTGTRTISGFNDELSNVEGSLKVFSDATTEVATLTVVSASVKTVPVTLDGTKPTANDPARGGSPASLVLNLRWTTAGAEFEGELSATDSVWDVSGTSLAPTKAKLAGMLRTVEGTTKTEFISGTFTATATGLDTFNATQPESAANTYTLGATFVGTVTAPNRPKLELTLASSVKAHEDDVTQATLNYKVYAPGSTTPRTTIAITGERAANGGTQLTLSESTSKLSMRLLPDAQSADLLYDGTLKIGQIARSSSVVTFTDNSFVSLASGL